MGWLEIIMLIIQYGPKILSLVSEIIDLLRKLRDKKRAEGLKGDLRTAIAHYKVTKDRRPLRELRDRIHAILDAEPKI